MTVRLLGLSTLALWLAGCDQLGIESAQSIAARREAEGKAVGSACRHAARALEDCYALNRKADKAAIFAGWREMNDYMRENKIESVTPQFGSPTAAAPEVPQPAPQPAPAETAEPAAPEPPKADKPAAKPRPHES